jgi:hypothetical protein
MTYTAEYWTDGCVSTPRGTVAVGSPHVMEFASITALASWVQFHQLRPTDDPPMHFGWYRARRSNGEALSAKERTGIEVPTAPCSAF